jgi:hypothetical protein
MGHGKYSKNGWNKSFLRQKQALQITYTGTFLLVP